MRTARAVSSNDVTNSPFMLFLELTLAVVGGFLFTADDLRSVRPRLILVATGGGGTATVLLFLAWRFDILPFDLPVSNWQTLMIGMGIYQSAAFLAATLLVPWACRATRFKTLLIVSSAALVVGGQTYGGGDLTLLPNAAEHFRHFSVGAAFAVGGALAGQAIRFMTRVRVAR